jgi:signal transduction histidine kinase
MSLSTFILDNHEGIIREFSAFAKTLMPDGADMSEQQLRDHAEEILTAIAIDMVMAQTEEERSQKSLGHGTAQTMVKSGKLHADNRIEHGFSFRSVLAEFRALRATVLKQYEESGQSDLSEVRRFNEAIDEALTESMNRFAMQTDLFRDQFIGVLSHDLRTPLTAIAMGAAALPKASDEPELRNQIGIRISNSARRMARMIDDLLDLTRARLGGAIPLKRQRADLQQICEVVMEELRAANPEVILRAEMSGPVIGDWDVDRLSQVISNLLGNAIQHGEGTPITITSQEEGHDVTFAVHNGGQPIPQADIPFIFEPLKRGLAESPASRSIGLGLFIARAVVSAHGGEIEVASSRVAGTTFRVTLPRGRVKGLELTQQSAE